MTALNAALSFIVASYAKSAKEETTRVVKVTSGELRAKRQPKAKVSGAVAAPSCNGATAKVEESTKPTMLIPEKGSLGAHGFMKLMRQAKDRQEKILAMQAYQGYDLNGDYGSQEMASLMAAKRELNPIDTSGPSLAEERSAKRNAMGFVNGLPNNRRKQVLDLLGREKATTDLMISHIKVDGETSAVWRPIQFRSMAALFLSR